MNVKNLIATCSIAAVGALTVGACGGGTSSGTGTAAHPGTAPPSSSVPNVKPIAVPFPITTTTTAPSNTLTKLNYAALIPTANTVRAQLRPVFDEALSVRAQQNDLAGYTARGLCGHKGTGDAVGGVLRQYLTARSDLSVTFAVESFSGDGAKNVMTTTKDSVNNCLMFNSGGAVWVKETAVNGDIHVQNIGDDTVTVTAKDVNTGVVTADAFVRKGQLVYQLRVVTDSHTVFSGTPSAMWEFMSQALHTFVDGAN
jgi:hypothetical protein